VEKFRLMGTVNTASSPLWYIWINNSINKYFSIRRLNGKKDMDKV